MHPKVYEAAKSGDFPSLMTIISEDGEGLSHHRTPKENNILHVAAQYQQVDLIKDLLRHPSGPSLLWQGNYKADTPLHVAAKVGSHEAVRVFVDLAKSPNQSEACKELLRKQNSRQDTVLHYAIRGGHIGVVKLLIEEDPQLCEITNASDESPLYLAADQILSEIFELILNASSSSCAHNGPKGFTALHAAVRFSLTSWWIILEKRPEAIRGRDDLGWTPLHYAACSGKVEEVQLLLQHDTNVAYDLDIKGQSALHVAAKEGHVSVVNELLRSCPDACDILSTKEQTALHAAVVGGQVNVVMHILRMPNLEYLINEQDIDGNTALHLAAHHKEYNIIYKLARDKRVDRQATNKDHLTAIQIFLAHNEVGYGAAKVHHLLEKGITKVQCAVPGSTKSDTALQGDYDAYVKFQLLVTGLIATVTYAASLTMPGGYNGQGMANLAGRAAFNASVILNSAAFGLSTLALSLQYFATARSNHLKVGYAYISGLCTYFAEVAMILAFACCTYVVLPRTTGLGIFTLVAFGGGLAVYHIALYFDPDLNFFGSSDSPLRRYGRKLLFDCCY
ncbi:ANK_REP_REGION domain-containing protein [Psidium guajava]|nr:ANK_REP_REGION domain-containing protein [Psidium guajava]